MIFLWQMVLFRLLIKIYLQNRLNSVVGSCNMTRGRQVSAASYIMKKDGKEMIRKTGVLLLAALLTGALSACGQGQDAEAGEVRTVDPASEEAGDTGQKMEGEEAPEAKETGSGAEKETDSGAGGEMDPDAEKKAAQWKQQFGENCIAEQTFEVELSEYSGKVLFVPYAPSGEEPEFHMQIVQNGQALTFLRGYVPETLEEEDFRSLDAVSFYDVNYDGQTDIVLIETYGDTSFAAVYYGYAADGDGSQHFFLQEQLSEQISERADTLTIPAIREMLSDGKKNGEFKSYAEAYEAAARLGELESAGEQTYGLIYVDDDEIPELAAGVNGYYTSLYTWKDGKLYALMEHWAYGAMGNAGYEYAPKKNNIRNYNSDYAGAILYTTYMEIGSGHTLDITAEIKTMNFDDVNQNGVPDEDELGSVGVYGVSYIDGKEVSNEACAAYDAGEYEIILGELSRDELIAELH